MAAEKSVDDLRHDRLFIANDATEDGFARREPGEKVRAKLILDRAEPVLRRAKGGALQSAKCFWVDRQLNSPGENAVREESSPHAWGQPDGSALDRNS